MPPAPYHYPYLHLCLCLAFLASACSPPPTSQAPLPAQVYLWQCAWTPDVQSAVRTHAPAFSRLVFLARQISFDNTQPRVTAITPDWDSLQAAGTQVAAAIRIATYPGPFEGPTATLLAQTVTSLLAEAAAHHVPLAEIQLDFDAATAKLTGYRTWLSAAQTAAGGVPVTITVLPSWLDNPAFAPLARQAGGYVLQVHGITKPRTAADLTPLCDPAAARAAIAKAARLNIPFRLALPTYSYALAFDADGTFLAMAAEGAAPNWAEGKTIRLAEAQPAELATLVHDLNASHPQSLQAIIWYRLPIDSDRLNWSWSTLASVMKGQSPAPAKLSVELAPDPADPALRDIQLVNTGQLPADTALRVTLSWQSATFIAADSLAGFQLGPRDPHHLQFTGTLRLPPDQRRTIGWIRLSDTKDLTAHVD